MNKEVYPEWYVDVKSICPNWDTQNFLDFMNLKLEDCKWKNITSIGWGFWIFEMDVAKAWANVTIVDPMFADKDGIDLRLKKNLEWMKSKTKWKMESKFWEMKKELVKALSESKTQKEMGEIRDKLQWYNESQAEVEKYLSRRKILINHLKNWKENQEKYWLILNPSSWDNIQWIDRNSQDFVVIAHTLWHIYRKSFGDLGDFLREAFKLLNSDWKLYIIDYVWDIPELEKMLEKTELKEYYKVNKGSFVCCFDKKWLGKFLDNELK